MCSMVARMADDLRVLGRATRRESKQVHGLIFNISSFNLLGKIIGVGQRR